MVDRNDVRLGYDDLAETYDDERAEGGRGIEILEGVLDGFEGPVRALDAGCGQGRPVLRRLSREGETLGLDFSRSQLALAREHAPRAAHLQGDMTRLPVADDAVDLVTAYNALIHVPLDEHPTVLEEFARVLRPGGRLVVTEGTREWEGSNPDWLDTGVEMAWAFAGPDATREQLRAAGFAVRGEYGATDDLAADDADRPIFVAEREKDAGPERGDADG